MNTIMIVTEANEKVATGHFMECVVCVRECVEAGYTLSFWLNDDMKKELKEKTPCPYQEYHQSIEKDNEEFFSVIKKIEPKVILFNLREISEEFLKKINGEKPDDTKVICIDEYGHRELAADIIINPMIDEYYWEYGESKAKLYCGAEYLVLSEELEEYHKKKKEIAKEIKKIVITMGGVDPQNYTEDLVEIIPFYFPESSVDIVLGGGYQNQDKIIDIIKRKKNDNIKVKKNITNLLELIYKADMVCCAGGNTLHETACIGTPAIVWPSMPHERRTAECFERQGFAKVVHTEENWKKEIREILEEMKNEKERISRSKRGKEIADGLGRKRVMKIVERILQEKLSSSV